ncbi:MAG: helix-turn-helix transcriptional regulator [Clostridia bacterium]|nr:helix-turn-helix transcriptional regulator [Clostridia bacterium]
MKIGKILKYGFYNSKKLYGNLKLSPKRTVKSFEFDYILSCEKNAISYIDEKSCKLEPNMLIIRKPGQKSNSRLHFQCYCLHISLEPDNPLFSELFAMPEYYTFINDKIYQPLFETLFQHLIKGSTLETDYFTSAKLLELIYHLKKDLKRNQRINQTVFKRENRLIQKAISYLNQNYQKQITLKELGKITGYSPNHLQRIFTDVMGLSPQAYLEKIRMDNAKFLLSQMDNSLADVAYECGFSSQSYFSKIFKKHTLLTPNEFRRKSSFKYDKEF